MTGCCAIGIKCWVGRKYSSCYRCRSLCMCLFHRCHSKLLCTLDGRIDVTDELSAILFIPIVTSYLTDHFKPRIIIVLVANQIFPRGNDNFFIICERYGKYQLGTNCFGVVSGNVFPCIARIKWQQAFLSFNVIVFEQIRFRYAVVCMIVSYDSNAVLVITLEYRLSIIIPKLRDPKLTIFKFTARCFHSFAI